MKIILVVLLTGITLNHAHETKFCTTPDNKFGACINIRDCDCMVQFLLSKTSFTLMEREFLNKYQCNSVNYPPYICCPYHGIIVSSVDSSSKVETPQTAQVKDHGNLRLLPADCGPTGLGDRIHKGNATKLYEYPWMALLSYQTPSGLDFQCGGTMINTRYILTAAHCTGPNLVGVRMGEYSIKNATDCEIDEDDEMECAKPVQDFFIEEVIIHSNYNKPHNASNDIALIRVAFPIQISKSVKPICLPTEEEVIVKLNEITQFTVTGWGTTEKGLPSDKLLKANIVPVPLEDCQSVYEEMKYTITETQICARGVEGSDSCTGDSGGPIQTTVSLNDRLRYVQGGIVSLGPTICANEHIPGVYTKIDKYMNWILDNMTD